MGDVRIAIEIGLYDNANTKCDRIGNNKEVCQKNNDTKLIATFDGEYKLYYKGISEKTMTLYCHNVLSDRPTEFISLHSKRGTKATNYSFAPIGGSCQGSSIKTTFQELRIDPWSLTVKTDDYTFAETVGGPL